MIRILLADDHPIVRAGLKRLVEDSGDMRVVGEASTGDEILAIARTVTADLVLLDVSMPGPGVLPTIERLLATQSDLRILVLSVQPEEEYAKRTLRAGARGYLMKDHSPEELIKAIRRIFAGGTYISSTMAEKLVFDLEGADRPPHHALSNREYEVLSLLAKGESLKEIGARLAVSPKTVSAYRARVLVKLDLRSTADLVRYAIQHQLDSTS